MSNPLKRYGEIRIVSLYDTAEKISSLKKEWTQYVKKGQIFCPSGACPFVPGDQFEYDTSNFLYYRARAITADVVNQNGDLFEHPEIKQAYQTFVGKGIYFNHDSDVPDKSFGIILDAMYTPVLYGQEDYADKYVEILGAIDRKAVKEKRPGLLEDVEKGRVTSTSMGTIAQKARCSICGNLATNMETLCFVPGTDITLADGSVVPIETIVVGDSVIDHTGTPRKVTQVFSRDVDEDIVDIKIEGLQFPVSCTGNHPIYSLKNAAGQTKRRGSVLLPPDFVHAHSLSAGDFIYSPVPQFGITGSLSDDEAEWLGWYASEGHIEGGVRPAAVGFTLHKDETEFSTRIQELGMKLFAWETKEYINGNRKAIRLNKKEAAAHAIENCGRGASTKFIGPRILAAAESAKKAFLCAYLKGDGHVSQGKDDKGHNSARNTVVLYTASKTLAYQLKHLSESLGVRAYIHYRHNTPGPAQRARGQERLLDIYAIRLSPLDANKFSDLFGKDLVKAKECRKLYAIPYSGGYVREIKSVTTRKYTGRVYNFEVEGTHSYVAGGIAVHNCDHVHPQSPLYMKGRNVFGKLCYETNYGLSFIEDSIVYVPADPTAHMLEVYASKSGAHFGRLAEVFMKYSRAVGRKIVDNPIEITSHFRTTGGALMEKSAGKHEETPEVLDKSAATADIKHDKTAPSAMSPYQESIKDLDEAVSDSAEKTLDNKIRRIIEEELRKKLAPLMEHMDKSLRPDITQKVDTEVSKIKSEVGTILPGGAEALKNLPATPDKKAEDIKSSSVKIAFLEDFSNWSDAAKTSLIEAVSGNKSYEFTGSIDLPEVDTKSE